MEYADWRPEPLAEPWFFADGTLRAALEDELLRELAPGQALFGARVTAVAKCAACDEAAFAIEDDRPLRWLRVHITWARHPEVPPLPLAEQHGTFRSCVTIHSH